MEQFLINITEKEDSFVFIINSTECKRISQHTKTGKETEFIEELKKLIKKYNEE